jgi:hypothetical protein
MSTEHLLGDVGLILEALMGTADEPRQESAAPILCTDMKLKSLPSEQKRTFAGSRSSNLLKSSSSSPKSELSQSAGSSST